MPSFMTAALPHSPHFPHHSFSNHPPTLGSYPSQHSLPNGSSKLVPSQSFPHNTSSSTRQPTYAASRQLPPLGNMPPSNSSSQMQYQQAEIKQEKRGPNWNDFYKNGVPQEIIVIDDDSPQPPPSRKRGNGQTNTDSQARAGAQQPAAKKRRTAQSSVYEPRRDYQPSYSKGRTYSQGNSNSNTASTDRTTSLQTTAPTSLGSHTSHGSSSAQYVEDVGVGQKRKRVTRQQIASEKRRQEATAVDAYVPPPKPPIKAKEVHVPFLKDVRTVILYY